MKRKVLVTVLVTVMASTMIACGNNEVSKVDDNTVQIEQSNTNNESETDTTVESTEEVENETETEVVKADFLEENGIEITPCGEMVMPLAITGTDNTQDMNVVTSVEVVPSEEAGYSDTIFTMIIELTDTTEDFSWYRTAFDRYTGYDFECTYSFFDGDGGSKKDDVCVIDIDGTQYDCSYSGTWEQTDDSHYKGTITIHHPSEYDGTVFQYGKCTASMREICQSIDYSTPFQITKYPELLDGQYFFTATNN